MDNTGECKIRGHFDPKDFVCQQVLLIPVANSLHRQNSERFLISTLSSGEVLGRSFHFDIEANAKFAGILIPTIFLSVCQQLLLITQAITDRAAITLGDRRRQASLRMPADLKHVGTYQPAHSEERHFALLEKVPYPTKTSFINCASCRRREAYNYHRSLKV